MNTFFTALRKWYGDRQTVDELARLSDLQLADVGLNRSSLERTLSRMPEATDSSVR